MFDLDLYEQAQWQECFAQLKDPQNTQTDWQQYFEQYKKALCQFESAVHTYADSDLDLIKEGITHRFQVSYQLALKLMKALLIERLYARFPSSRGVTKMAFATRLITDEEIWLAMIKTGKQIYTDDGQLIHSEFRKIVENYLPLMIEFKQRIEQFQQDA